MQQNLSTQNTNHTGLTLKSRLNSFFNRPLVFYPVLFFFLAYLAFSYLFSFGINFTHSLPYKYFIFAKHFDVKDLEREDIVKARYLNGYAFEQGSLFVKRIGGMPGDEITHIGQDVYINGKHIGTAKLFGGINQDGDPLDMSEPGVIPNNYYFLYTSHPDSFDSRYRYLGLVHERWIKGKSLIGFGAQEEL
ncbi:MAG: S26 family signal peptidase [Methyloprofundus sp.]|nr:S26 family signal peptidase [Methyloprofundus sp.]